MIVKYGDGAIVSVLKEEELTEEQKKSAEVLSAQTVKKGEDEKEPKKLESN